MGKIAAVLFVLFSFVAAADWMPHTVRLVNGDKAVGCPAQLQIATEAWNRVVAVPYIVHMPEKDEVLMLVACDYPHQAMVLSSADHGATWCEPRYVHVGADGKPDTGMATGLTYLGNGRVMLMTNRHWLSRDYGRTWENASAVPPIAEGVGWYMWDPLFVDRDAAGAIARLVETGYGMDHAWYTSGKGPGYSTGYLRTSRDEGLTWSAPVQPPSWKGVSEVTLARAKNGWLVAACRTDIPERFKGETLDHYEGLATSVSKDDGATWSELNRLYAWGRHHPSLVLLPDGNLLMTYVVRKGYVDTPDGFPQFGIEAVLSDDNGRTWDLDHRYILHQWPGNRKGLNSWWPSSQATSNVLFPDGALLTAFGTGYRSQPNDQNMPVPRDVGLVLWRLSDAKRTDDAKLRNAPWDSDQRNILDPAKP